ncbi:tyrosine-type recombinase/integrase [Psychromonas aquatilis]|uniref:Tyrosine-type recombinase/integrase n=1 Tax=Psychromonas aquatilis TaxID=2005072 RepID=A0ABU9GSV0_9GAMM
MALFTLNKIIGFKTKQSSYYEWEDDGTKGMGRLGVKIFSSGSKRFVFRYYVDGNRKFIKIGDAPTSRENGVTLAAARLAAKKYGAMLQAGLDPRLELGLIKAEEENKVKVEAQKGSIEQLFNSYTSQMKKDGKRTYKAVLKSLEKEVYPYIKPETKAKNVTKDDLVIILSHMIKRGALTQSNRVRSYLMAAFNYGLAHDNDPANFIDDAKFGLLFNPVSAIPKQKSAEKVGEHFLSDSEVKLLLNDLNNEFLRFQMGNSIRNLISLLFYTGGQRPFELASSKWESINWEAKTLLITTDISKNKRPHLVPLTESAIFILSKQKENSGESDFIFPHRFDRERHITLDSLSRAIARYRNKTDIRPFIPRDIRRTCKTLMGELGISKSIRDRLQNHALHDVSSKHYDRYEYMPEKQRALEAWEQKLNEVAVNNILAFGGV